MSIFEERVSATDFAAYKASNDKKIDNLVELVAASARRLDATESSANDAHRRAIELEAANSDTTAAHDRMMSRFNALKSETGNTTTALGLRSREISERVTKLAADLNQHKLENFEARDKLDALATEVVTAADHDFLRRHIDDAHEAIKQLDDDAATVTELDELEQRMQSALASFARDKVDANELAGRVNKIEKIGNENANRVNDLTSQLSTNDNRFKSLDQRISSTAREAEHASKMAHELDDAFLNLDTDIKAHDNDIKQLSNDAAAMRKTINDAMKTAQTDDPQKIADLEARADALESTVSALANTMSTRAGYTNIEDLDANIQKLANQFEAKLNEHKEALNEINDSLDYFDERVNNQPDNDTIEALDHRIANQNNRINDAIKTAQEAHRQATGDTNEINRVAAAAADFGKNMDDLAQQIGTLSRSILAEADERRAESRETRNELGNAIDTVNAAVQSIAQQVQTNSGMLRNVPNGDKLAQALQATTDLNERINSLASELHSTQQSIEANRQAIAEVKEPLH